MQSTSLIVFIRKIIKFENLLSKNVLYLRKRNELRKIIALLTLKKYFQNQIEQYKR